MTVFVGSAYEWPTADEHERQAEFSRHLRGYDNVHYARRRQVAPLVNSGQAVCSRCGGPISPREQWHLDHADNRKGYIGVAHAYCNLRAAGIKSQRLKNPANQPQRIGGRESGSSRSRPALRSAA